MELPRRSDAESDAKRRVLPSGTPRRTWAGHGTGGPCDFCEQLIRPEQVEYEVELQGGSTPHVLHLHLKCYQDWMITAQRGANDQR